MALISLEPILNVKKHLHQTQTILDECKYDAKNIKRNNRTRRIDYGFEKSSSDESDNEPESEIDNGLKMMNLKSLLLNLIIKNLKSLLKNLIKLSMLNQKTLF